MSRYFIELTYKGTTYSGFQVQENAVTVQSEVEKAFEILHRRKVQLTGSSRTDAGVHALKNYFHFDEPGAVHPAFVYKMNAILPQDIVIRNIYNMHDRAHARFDAISRRYVYHIHRFKDPFLRETSLFYPYRLDLDLMQEAASYIKGQTDFSAFSKTNSQVKNFTCSVLRSDWAVSGDSLVYTIEANRFLRGMVRLITAILLKMGRGKYSMDELKYLFASGKKAGSSVPAHGLFLQDVQYPADYFPVPEAPFTGS